MEKIEVPDGVDKEEAEQALKRKAKRKQSSRGSRGKSKSEDDGSMDGLIIIGGVLLALGLAADKVLDFVLSLV